MRQHEEDREAIRELHNQYCFIQDRGDQHRREEDVQQFLALCAPEFVVKEGRLGRSEAGDHARMAGESAEVKPRRAEQGFRAYA